MRWTTALAAGGLAELAAHLLTAGWGLAVVTAALLLSATAQKAKTLDVEKRLNAHVVAAAPAISLVANGGTIGGTLTVSGNHTVTGSQTVNGQANSNTLYVSGSATTNGNHTINGAANVGGNVSANNFSGSANGTFNGQFQGSSVVCPQSRPPNPAATLASLQTELTNLITSLSDGNMIS
jgi:hypothetical protein